MAIFGRKRGSFATPTDERVIVGSSIRPAALEQKDARRKYKRVVQPWQKTVFTYYRTVPECWYAAQFYARSLSSIRLYVGKEDEQGEVRELPAGHEASALLARVQDPGGGRSQLLSSYGRLTFMIGEGYLVATIEDGDEYWEFLSPEEMRLTDDKNQRYVRLRAPGLEPEEIEDIGDEQIEAHSTELEDGRTTKLPEKGERGKTQAVVWRLWRSDPEYSAWADSPMRSVLDLFEELLLLQLAVRARAKSRLAGAGLLFLAKELDFNNPDQDSASEDSDAAVFMQRLQQAMVTPIKDPGSATAVVPIVAQIDAELMDKAAKLLKIHDPTEKYPEENLRTECIGRIATGLDMPREMLLGLEDSNHWTAWQIDEQTYKAHIRPVCLQLASDLTSAYLRPAARLAGLEDADKLVVWWDAAELVNHPDRAKDAKDLHDRGVISAEALREATGFKDDDAMSEEEKQLWLAREFGDPALAGIAAPGAGDADLAGVVAEAEAALAEGATGETVADVVAEAEAEMPVRDEDADQKKKEKDRTAVVAAADLAVLRARETAGARVRSKVNGDLKDTPNIDLVAALGKARRAELGIQPSSLVAGGARLYETWLESRGVDGQVARKLGELVETHAARYLEGEHQPLPESFAGYVSRVV